ncbi:hypothetical protein MRB53_014984 [Persea americana]|uniref:Uncharacterized protein n=1 Tax=Persea americana TaxID=3435 RepID=A0ACC2KCK8_PERAE|nr:hypothetical protein MRB53_014984 [Persea americana]
MGFLEGKTAEEKVLGGTVFPKVLHPSCTDESGTGFQVFSPEDFARVVESFKWDEMCYMGATTRVKVAHRVHTANEAPLHQLINFHHEMSLLKEFPSKIFFFCSVPSPEGGETSIVPSHIILEKMEERVPEFVRRLSETGCIFSFKTPKEEDSGAVVSKTWKTLLQTDDQVEAENRARAMIACDSVVFNQDGSAEFIFGPMNPIKELEGKRVWFRTILSYTGNERDVEVSFSDGSPFPVEATNAYKSILEENCVDLSWQKGDILLVDNLSVQHARRPGKPPRVILVSICK